MDPGNWATDLEGGARFGYQLIWVLLMSNLMAVLLQTLAARLGIVAGRDLAQACRDHYPKPISYGLWILCELAIAACDLAEVLGTAIGINLLFGVPLIYGVLITGSDTLLFLVIQQFGIRNMEAVIIGFVLTIGLSFGVEVFLAQPEWALAARGLVPQLSTESLYVAVAILGATVMPHNLYLHSAIVQSRVVEQSDEGKKIAGRFNLIDTAVALNGAFFINAAILIVSAAVFNRHGVVVTEIQQAHQLLAPLLGTTLASTLFAIALISAGQSSTLTGTLAGQIVMEGFLRFKMRPALRRLLTRTVAIIPALAVIALKGDEGSYDLLILSQVILSLQLPFAVIPLIKMTSSRRVMGKFASPMVVRGLGWIVAAVIVALNAWLLLNAVSTWIAQAGPGAIWPWFTLVPAVAGIGMFLVYISLPDRWLRKKKKPAIPPVPLSLSEPQYRHIGIALDYGPVDAKVVSHALTLARHYHAVLHLFHVVEGVSGQLYGNEADDVEAREDNEHLEAIARRVREEGVEVVARLGYGNVPREIVRLAVEEKVDVIVMGGHGHRGLKDILFGTSISEVRHRLTVPVLVVQ
jgi:manganese transport protein